MDASRDSSHLVEWRRSPAVGGPKLAANHMRHCLDHGCDIVIRELGG